MTARTAKPTARKKPGPADAAQPAARPTRPPIGDLPMPGTPARHPALGLGLWGLGRWTTEDETRTRETLAHAVEAGIRWIDTAEVYGSGRSERLLGDLLANHPPLAPPAFLTTKVSWEHLRGPMVRPALLGSLRRLGRSRVDVYLVHAPDPHVPLKETMAALEALWKEGKIGAIGVSNFSAEELVAAKTALREAPLVVNQVRYSLLERDEGDAALDAARELGIVLEAYTPLARGLLAGRYLDGESPSPQVRTFARDLFDKDRFPELRERSKRLRTLAEKEGVPLAALALHWLARRGVAPVFGASRPRQVDEVLSAWSARPSEGALDRAEAIARGDA
ncbi:MAG TPA: aldo/keto reductase [Thermoplasmata archaeon]|nr:aldo/keto reductase [Thermoplasmata archaeon]